VANHIRVTLEIGPKGKKVVAVAPDWPGLERGAKTGEAAIERLRSYVPRYATVTKLAGMEAAFANLTDVDVVEQYPGTGSTDFWGVSFAFSSIDQQAMSGEALERELTLMRACWAFFDDVRSRVSAEMQRGSARRRARSGPHRPSYICRGAGLGEEARRAHASGRDADRRRIERASRRLLQCNSGIAFPEQNGPHLAAQVSDPAHCVSHARSRLGDGRQRSDCQTSVRPSAKLTIRRV
jgi:hypothetical protein